MAGRGCGRGFRGGFAGGFVGGFAGGFRGFGWIARRGASERLTGMLGLVVVDEYNRRCNKLSRSENEREYINVVARRGKECKVVSTKYMYMNRGVAAGGWPGIRYKP